MAARTVTTLKFVGSISLGLLTGLSYTLSTLTIPTILSLDSASSGSRAFSRLSSISLTHLRTLAGISSSSFLLAYLLSPRNQKHPYLLWTTLFVATSGLSDLILPRTKTIAPKSKPGRGRTSRTHMEASYEVLGDSNSDGTTSGAEDGDEEVNGEEVKEAVEGFLTTQIIRTVVAGVGFAMSVVGIWGDGAADTTVIIEV